MTTEIVKSREIAVAAAVAGAALTGITLAGDVHRTNGKLSGRKGKAAKNHPPAGLEYKPADAQTLFATLEQHQREKEGWDRSMSATLALLKQAHNMLEQAETRIFEQEQRICQLEKVATTDELTGLLNRRGFYDAFSGEIERCNRGLVQSGLLVLIDLDNFKMINDTYGHLAGDAALRLVARTLKTEIRAMDSAARLGGDEFVLLLSHTSKRDAASRAQTIGWKLNNLSLAWYGEEIPVRASLGLKDFRAGDKAEMIFNAADAGLYEQKESRKGSRESSRTVLNDPLTEEQSVTA
ncbi:MAG: GGDEF domain-containing protein [Micavibrio aeruginosavorus]|uniref:diguanylate cyclase n=1 Tax=Micavibrio aeruginosavorus TaxID=349221 RepID=A0A7T5R3N0_9BACT|nr:MAG: GGDEF domain-containing protein [Micavibrio aeruginosavorus]